MSDNPHLGHMGEHLAHDCLNAAGGDYTVALDLVLAGGGGECLDHACEALALWAALAPIANDNKP